MNRKMLLRPFDRPPGAQTICFCMKKRCLLMLHRWEGLRESEYAQKNLQPIQRTFLYASRPRHFSLVENSYSTLKSALSLDSGSYRT